MLRERRGVWWCLLQETCLGGRKDDLMDWFLVADLDGSDLQTLGALPRVKQSQLSVVAPSDQEVGVLGVVLQTQKRGGRLQNVLWFVGVLWERRHVCVCVYIINSTCAMPYT